MSKIKHDLNLTLSNIINNLKFTKPSIQGLTNHPINMNSMEVKFSHEQQRAISTTEPLVLIHAKAGTGKSTVISGRIVHMLDAGIKPEDIMVLSSTRDKVDKITTKHSNIKSMTITRMIHTIYSANFPTHELSNIDTIINALHTYFDGNNTAYTLRKLLNAVEKNQNGSYTALNNFIEDNFREVMEFLDTIKQTSLELEIIMCYQLIDTLTEPKEVQSKYLIVDEIQDNSIFEVGYLLKYSNKNKTSLFIAGDCSQTLYWFREADAKTLLTLEASGLFASYQLQTNYRSNQEILNFANILLNDIETNRYAQTNLSSQITKKSFTDKVILNYKRINRLPDAKEMVINAINNEVGDYIKEKINKGEQVTILAHSRDIVTTYENTLKTIYTNKQIVNLTPELKIDDNGVKHIIVSDHKKDYNNADIILSTIHSAKGLEFDNVVVTYRNDNSMTKDYKHMYHVALTRAKKTEYILAYDTVSSPLIKSHYDSLVESLI